MSVKIKDNIIINADDANLTIQLTTKSKFLSQNISILIDPDEELAELLVTRKISTYLYDNIHSIIGQYAFAGCTQLTAFSSPICTTVQAVAFGGCTYLKSISLPVCTSFGTWVFYGCANLVSISLPQCTSLPAYTFSYCNKLSNVSFPKCTYISSYTFYSCTALSKLSLPKCTNIYASGAFSNCSNLRSLYLMNSVVVNLSNSNAFTNTPMTNSTYLGTFGSIYVPTSLVASYKAATNWSYFSARIVGA